MKVILTRDLAKVGRKHEVKEVADGYARNFIIARGFGLPATRENLGQLAVWIKEQGRDERAQATILAELKEKMGEKTLILKAKANAQGHLFASLHVAQILAALEQQFHLSLPADWLAKQEPLKEIGDYELKLKTPQPEPGSLRVRVEALDH